MRAWAGRGGTAGPGVSGGGGGMCDKGNVAVEKNKQDIIKQV